MVEKQSLRLSEFLPYRLSVLSNSISGRIAEDYSRVFGLNINQWRIMAVLGETPGLTATELTELTVLDKVAISRAVASLIGRDYVAREAAQEDGRRSILRLSEKGERVYRDIVPQALSYERALTEAVSAEDLLVLNRLLSKFAKVVSPDRPLW